MNSRKPPTMRQESHPKTLYSILRIEDKAQTSRFSLIQILSVVEQHIQYNKRSNTKQREELKVFENSSYDIQEFRIRC